PRWIDNVTADPNFLRAEQAETAGLRSGVAVSVFAMGNIFIRRTSFRLLSRLNNAKSRANQSPLFAAECLMKEQLPSACPGIRLEHVLPPDLPLVLIDKDKMR